MGQRIDEKQRIRNEDSRFVFVVWRDIAVHCKVFPRRLCGDMVKSPDHAMNRGRFELLTADSDPFDQMARVGRLTRER